MILFQFYCKQCDEEFEDLVYLDDPDPPCPTCLLRSEKIFCYNPSANHSPKYAEIHMKWQNIKNKREGKVPWRKSSESQSS